VGTGHVASPRCFRLPPQLAAVRRNVLIVSTDPAHNLSDAFGQKFGRKPTLVDGFSNLYCMEIDSSAEMEEMGDRAPGVSRPAAHVGVGGRHRRSTCLRALNAGCGRGCRWGAAGGHERHDARPGWCDTGHRRGDVVLGAHEPSEGEGMWVRVSEGE